MRRTPGYLITVEGIGGSGKTTLVAALASWLTSTGVKVVTTHEPGGTVTGKAIRGLALSAPEPLSPITEAFLFEADRTETYTKVIRPALADRAVVISDRNVYGTVAYQVFGGGVQLELVDTASEAATGGLHPDLVLILDLTPELAALRLAQVGGGDRFDRRDTEFQRRVRNGFLFAAERDGPRAKIIDASRAAEAVLAEARTRIASLLKSDYAELES